MSCYGTSFPVALLTSLVSASQLSALQTHCLRPYWHTIRPHLCKVGWCLSSGAFEMTLLIIPNNTPIMTSYSSGLFRTFTIFCLVNTDYLCYILFIIIFTTAVIERLGTFHWQYVVDVTKNRRWQNVWYFPCNDLRSYNSIYKQQFNIFVNFCDLSSWDRVWVYFLSLNIRLTRQYLKINWKLIANHILHFIYGSWE